MLSDPGLTHVCAYRLFISDRANENTYIEMHACCSRFHQQELEPFSHFSCLQDHSTFSCFAKKSKSLWRPFELSLQQPCFLDVTPPKYCCFADTQLINVTRQSRNLIFSNRKGYVCLNSDRDGNLESRVKSVIWSYGFLFCINRLNIKSEMARILHLSSGNLSRIYVNTSSWERGSRTHAREHFSTCRISWAGF